MSGHDHYVGPVTEALLGAGFTDPVVTITGTASVGANRATLFVDIEASGEVVQAVAQIGSAAESVAAVADEAAVLGLAGAAGVPVAQILGAGSDLGHDNASVLVTTRVEGLSIPRQILRSVPEAAAGEALAEQCGAALAQVHKINIDELPASLERLDEAAPHADYCAKLDQQLGLVSSHHPAVRWGINWLRRNPPSPSGRPTLVHADFRNGNMLVHEGQLAAILDWELAHVGDPMEDLAWMCLRMWRFGKDDRPCGGFGSVEALRRGYESGGGVWREDAFQWWLAARSAWWAIGLARMGERFGPGGSSSIVHAASGRRVAELEYDLLTLIRTQEN